MRAVRLGIIVAQPGAGPHSASERRQTEFERFRLGVVELIDPFVEFPGRRVGADGVRHRVGRVDIRVERVL